MKHIIRRRGAWLLWPVQLMLAWCRDFTNAARVYTYRQQLLLGQTVDLPRNMTGINV